MNSCDGVLEGPGEEESSHRRPRTKPKVRLLCCALTFVWIGDGPIDAYLFPSNRNQFFVSLFACMLRVRVPRASLAMG